MDMLKKLEAKGVELFDTKAPWKMPKNARKSLANASWILALVFGILQLWTVLFLWDVGHAAQWLWSSEFGYRWGYHSLSFFYYLSIMVLLVESVVLLVSASALKALKKDGWYLLFTAVLLNMAYGVVRLYLGIDGLITFFWAFVWTIVALYFLFQVRGEFAAHGSKQK